MLTKKQNFLETLKQDGHPDRLVNGYSPFQFVWCDPVFLYLKGIPEKGMRRLDPWGTLVVFPEDSPAPVPVVTEENQVIKDLEFWEDYLIVPDLQANCLEGWETVQKNKAEIDTEEYLSAYLFPTGLFEQMHNLMNFEDTLCSFLEYPDETMELIERLTEFRLEYLKLIVENLHPDVILSHDDWGSKDTMFFSPDVWREFFKEPYRRIYQYLHDNDIIVMHHCDSYCEPIVEDMAEIGIDVWQGVLPTNDIVAMTEKLQGRMTLMGGIDSIVDRADTTEEEIRCEVQRVFKEYGHLKHFIPSMTYGDPMSIFPGVADIISDEIDKLQNQK